MNLRNKISTEELRQLYVEDGMTIDEIAAHFHLGATTISRRLDDLGITTRPRGPLPVTHFDSNGSMATPEWSPALAYAVGLIATDGNLSGDGRHMTVVSKDRDLLETFRECLGLNSNKAALGLDAILPPSSMERQTVLQLCSTIGF